MADPRSEGESAEGSATNPIQGLSKRLDPAAKSELQRCLSGLRQEILIRASNTSIGDVITEEDLHQAYHSLDFPARDSLQRTDAQTIISQALRENRTFEWIAYGMAIVFFAFGLLLLSIGVVNSDGGIRAGAFFGGSVVELMILVPFRVAVNSRRHNIALRMLGIILNRVHDPQRLAALLKETFAAVVLGKLDLKAGR